MKHPSTVSAAPAGAGSPFWEMESSVQKAMALLRMFGEARAKQVNSGSNLSFIRFASPGYQNLADQAAQYLYDLWQGALEGRGDRPASAGMVSSAVHLQVAIAEAGVLLKLLAQDLGEDETQLRRSVAAHAGELPEECVCGYVGVADLCTESLKDSYECAFSAWQSSRQLAA